MIRERRALLIGSFTSLAAAFMFVSVKAADPPSGGCMTTSGKPLVSPDGAFSAIVRENACESGYAFTATANFTVDVISQSDSTKHALVFSTDDHGASNERPLLSWLAPKRLQITALSQVGVGLHKTAFSTVTITYSFTDSQPKATGEPVAP